MSLDVRLTVAEPVTVASGSGIFARLNGQTVQLTREEWDKLCPGVEPVTFLRDDQRVTTEVFKANITHNLGKMAAEAGIYQHLWRPEEIAITTARQLIEPLCIGLALMRREPARFRVHDAHNGWGTYDNFVPWIQRYLDACCQYPEATISVDR